MSRSCSGARVVAQALVVLLVSIVLASQTPGWGMTGSEANDEIVGPPVVSASRPGDRAFHLEFRARADAAFGHAFMILDATDARGQVRRTGVFGFGTANGAPSGLLAILGSVGEIGTSRADLARPPVERFRVSIDRRTHDWIVAAVGEMRQTWVVYQLLFLNCNTFAGVIAALAGLQAPAFDALFPADYVAELRTLNTRDTASR